MIDFIGLKSPKPREVFSAIIRKDKGFIDKSEKEYESEDLWPEVRSLKSRKSRKRSRLSRNMESR